MVLSARCRGRSGGLLAQMRELLLNRRIDHVDTKGGEGAQSECESVWAREENEHARLP